MLFTLWQWVNDFSPEYNNKQAIYVEGFMYGVSPQQLGSDDGYLAAAADKTSQSMMTSWPLTPEKKMMEINLCNWPADEVELSASVVVTDNRFPSRYRQPVSTPTDNRTRLIPYRSTAPASGC